VTTTERKSEVRRAVRAARDAGARIALVPTMGALHEAHLSLVDRARSVADYVVLSVYVNPLQFGRGEDLDRYPRDLDRDVRRAEERGVDLVFAPSDAEMYGLGEPAVYVVPGPLADRLCGAFRPEHFRGVLTVVAKLFGIVQPDVAVFGQKDFQQSVLIRRMVADLDMPVEVVVAPTVREADGLALSSRNAYLDPEDRAKAAAISGALQAAEALARQGERHGSVLLRRVREALAAVPGITVEYVELVDPETLEPRPEGAPGTVLAVAAFVGGVRLIDNVVLS
jgi:pantoate--beta-alanine ligase